MPNIISITFGLGGWCENCESTHDHPLNNITEIIYEEESE